MTEITNRTLLESVVKLVEKSDLNSLDLSLVNTVSQIIPSEKITIAQIHEHPDLKGQKIVKYIPIFNASAADIQKTQTVSLEKETELLECLTTQRMVVSTHPQATGVRVIHPIQEAEGITGFLIIDCLKSNPKDQELVSILLGFYKNYVSLLNDSQRDKLTGLLNRKTFDEKIMKIIVSQNSENQPAVGNKNYILAILDIDHFKNVNDQFGHLYGDEVLLLFSGRIKGFFREDDLLFRVGGEEFVVVLDDVNLETAISVLERFRKKIESFSFPQVGQITASIGVSQIIATDLPTTIVDRADQALYYAKNNGRNQVCSYENLIAEGKLVAKNKITEADAELF